MVPSCKFTSQVPSQSHLTNLQHHAAANDKPEVMQYNGAILDSVATEGDTPLISAIAYDCYLATEMLIKLGPNIEAANLSLNRPLTVACKLEREKMVQVLVENGADIHGKGCDGVSDKPLPNSRLSNKIERSLRYI